MVKELSEQLLATEILSLCIEKPRTVEQMTNVIYKNLYAKNIVRVYQTVEILMKRGVIIPKFSNREIHYKIKDGILK